MLLVQHMGLGYKVGTFLVNKQPIIIITWLPVSDATKSYIYAV